ncbi:MAG: hypothetical protein IJ841_11605 [Prevotella sp.]|nr:hypothetical protein [Prevotella sp.]
MRGKRLLPYLCLPIVGVLLVAFEQDLLYQAQEQNLFLHTTLFFEQQMVRAGGMLTWAGAYLTQFFYYPMLGAGLLCLLWALFMWLLVRAFRLADAWMTLLPVACLLLTVVDLGYWVYYLKLPGHPFCATLGGIVVASLVWGYRLLPRKYGLPSVFILLTACVGYPLFGFYALWATVLMGIMAWQAERHRVLDAVLAVGAVVAVPRACYELLYHETHLVNIYWAALPVYCHTSDRLFAYNLPYVGLVLSTLCFAIGPWQHLRLRWLRPAVLVAAAVCVAVFWQKDDNFHRELSMSRSMERQDWPQLLRTAKATKGEPTRAICLMKNLALYRLGRPAEEMLSYPEGAHRPDAPFSIRLVHTVGKMLYLQYGLPNYCYRWCMEDGVEFGWTVERLKLMAKCSLLNGEHVAAQRYLNMLKKTDFHRAWARKYERYLHDHRLMEQDTELRAIRPLMRADNFLTADQSQLELFLIEQILSTPGKIPEQRELARRTMFYYRNNPHELAEQ